MAEMTGIQVVRRRQRRRKAVGLGLRYLVLILTGVMMVYPLLWMLGSSLKATNNEIFASISFIPQNPTFEGYKAVLNINGHNFFKFMLNTYTIVLPKVFGAVISSVLTAYGFSRFRFIGNRAMFAVLLSTIFLPQVVLNIPQYLLFVRLGWVNSYKPLVVPSFFASEPYFVFMLVQFMRTLPRDMEEAAEIDGCNSLQRLIYVIAPVIKPAIISVALFQFMWASNDFQGPLIYISSVNKYPASLGLRLVTDSESSIQWNKVLALSIVSILPTLIVFFLAQDQFVDGIAMGSLKG